MGLNWSKINDFATQHCVDNIEELSIVENSPNNVEVHLSKELVQNFKSLRSVSYIGLSGNGGLEFITTLGEK